MKICVCSDSHGNWYGLQEMVDRENPEMLWFLGDGERDWGQVKLSQQTAFVAVCGNCDFMSMEPPYRKIKLYGKTIYLTHGHLYGAKQGLYGLMNQALQHQADMVLYGHTHHAQLDEREGCLYLCPGSMGHQEERYAIVTIPEDGGNIEVEFKKLK